MKLEDLDLFLNVANYKSMTTAANILYLAPQNVSKIISKMETELDTTLFTRTRQGCYLTESGTALYSVASEMLKQWNYFQQAIPNKKNNTTLTGSIRILASNQLIHLVAAFAKEFQNDYPNIKIDLIEQPTLYIHGDVINSNNFDIICSSYERSFLMKKNEDGNRRQRVYILKEEPLRLFFNKKNSDLTNLSLVSNNQLNDVPLVLYRTFDSNKTIFSDALEQAGIHPNYIFSSNNISLCQQYVIDGTAAYIDTNLMFNSTFHPLYIPEIVSLPLQEKITICHALFLNRNLPPHVELFLQYFRNHFDLYEI